MKQVALVIVALLLAGFAIVAFSDSPQMRDAALAPITVTPSGPVEPAPPAPEPGMEPPAGDAVANLSDASTDGLEEEPGAALLITPPPSESRPATECETELKALGVIFEPQPPIPGEAGCGVDRPLKVSSVGVALKPAIVTRCEMAKTLAVWTKDVMAPSAALHLKAAPSAILTGDSYQCRARRGDGEVKVSEHAKANAIDVAGIEFAGRETVPVKDRTGSGDGERAFQAAIRGGACAYFTTVLGPGTNAAHADHLHLDLIDRGNGYRICE
ncbi:MAG: extensin family protein [Sphingomonadales bacterium]